MPGGMFIQSDIILRRIVRGDIKKSKTHSAQRTQRFAMSQRKNSPRGEFNYSYELRAASNYYLSTIIYHLKRIFITYIIHFTPCLNIKLRSFIILYRFPVTGQSPSTKIATIV